VQLELSTVITIVVSILTFGIGIFSGTLRYTIAQKDKSDEARFEKLELALAREQAERLAGEKAIMSTQAQISERLHADEVDTVKIQGDLALLRQTQGAHSKLFDDLDDKIVTRGEWETRMNALERQLERVLDILEQKQRPGSYGLRPPQYPTPGPMPAVRGSPAESAPPEKTRR
jgi:hypothetical protein